MIYHMGILRFTCRSREFAMSMIFDEVNKHRTSRNVSKDAMKLMFWFSHVRDFGDHFAVVSITLSPIMEAITHMN